MRLLLDTGVLGQICHPRKHDDVRAWFQLAARDHAPIISEQMLFYEVETTRT